MTLKIGMWQTEGLEKIQIKKSLSQFMEFFTDEKTGVPNHTLIDCVVKPTSKITTLPTQCARRSLFNEDTELRRYLDKNLKLKLIEQTSSEIASPILFVKKKDNSMRLYVDYCQLIACFERVMYP
jgi:hypothetical protein